MIFNDYLQAGGERQSVASEVRALRSAGHNVNLLTVNNESLSDLNSFGRMKAIVSNKTVMQQLDQAIVKFGPDIVHAENLFPQLGGAAIDALRLAGVPWVRTIRNYRKGCLAGTFARDGHGCTLCSGTELSLPGIKHACYRGSRSASLGASASRLIDSRAESRYPPGSYISVSRFVAGNIESDLVDGVPNHAIHNAISVPEDVKARSIQARTFDLCFVGRLEEEKGVRIALDVAESMNVAAVVIGDGSLRSEVQERSRKSDGQIRYMGALSYVDTMRTLADTKLVLVPSAWDEPFGRVAAEALAVGALPLVSNRGGLPEIVAGLDYSAVVDTFSTDAWILAASSLLSVGDADMEILSHSAIGHWKALFSEEALAAKLVEVYRVVTGKSSVGKTYE